MKKAILLALVFALVIAFAACGNNDGDTTTVTPDPAPTTTPDPAPTTTPDPATTTTPDTTTETVSAAPDFDTDLDGFLDYHFPATDLGGITLRWVGFGNVNHYNPVYAARYQERARRVEERFNVNLEFIEDDDIVAIAGAWSDVPDVITASVAAGDPIAHIFRGNAGYWFPALANGGYLINIDAHARQFFPEQYYEFAGQASDGTVYGFMNRPAYSWNIMVYNRDMIRAAGMHTTPSEMFMAGNWSLDDFYDYLVELNQLLPDDVTPSGIHNTWWKRLASYANGSYLLNPRTSVPGILHEATLEPLNMLQRLVAEGLHLQPGFITPEDGSPFANGHFTWGDAAIGGSNARLFLDGRTAITSMAPWSFEEIGTYFEFGIVPPPWGSNVQFPASGDWRELKDYGYKSVFNDATSNMMIVGTPEVVTPEVMTNMILTWYEYAANDLITNRELAAQGGDFVLSLNSSQNLWTPTDVALWEWYASNPTWEGIDSGGFWILAYQDAWLNILGGGGDFRAGFEAAMPALVWSLYDFGRIAPENIPPAIWLQAQEFGANIDDED